MTRVVDDKKLYDVLSEMGVIDQKDLNNALKESTEKQSDKNLAQLLLDNELITDENLGKVMSEILEVPFIRLNQVAIDTTVLNILPEVVAKKERAIVFAQEKTGISLALENPVKNDFVMFLAKKTGLPIKMYLATSQDIEDALGLYKKDIKKSFDLLMNEQISSVGKEVSNQAPIIKTVDMLIDYAAANRASDIHIEPGKEKSAIRFRIDGILHDVLEVNLDIHEQIVTRIKVMSKLRTDEKMSAQDGKLQKSVEGNSLDIRVSIVPIVNGEKVVMRLLSAKARQISLLELGMSHEDIDKLRSGFSKPYGMILSTGPTGSGKTTTIYAVLKEINVRKINISTIEDPVEYDIEGINQIQVNPKTNLTFASGLRAILRQDPNVIFVGEIRDEETAAIAVNSAMTGHLVLSTLHTNDAATTLPRLLDLHIEPFLVASTVNVIIGQRLVRKICLKCRMSYEEKIENIHQHFPKDYIEKVFGKKSNIRLYKGKGCPVCFGSGYQGRVGLFEVLVVDSKIRELVTGKADYEVIRKQAIASGMTSMLADGLSKVAGAVTTIDEVLRAVKE